MFADPQTVTINAVAQTLPRIKVVGMTSLYRKDDGSLELEIGHDEKNRNRRVIRFNHQKIAADPLTADNVKYTMSSYIVIDVPTVGYTNTELKDVILGLTGWATSANVLKVLGGEN